MVKKSKCRQKIKMIKIKNESNLQVTFSKRRFGLFKKASELYTLCDAEIAIIMFSPGRKPFSFGHPNVETLTDRFLNNNPLPSHQSNSMQLSEVHRNYVIQDLNNHLTQMMNQLESEKKKNEELKKRKENSKWPVNWWEEPIETLDLVQAYEFKGKLENLKKMVTIEASKFYHATIPHQNSYVGSSSNTSFGDVHQNSYVGSSSITPFGVDGHQNFYVGSSSNPPSGVDGHPNFYVGSSRNSPFGIDGGNNINPNLEQLNQRRTVNMTPFYDHEMSLPNHSLPSGNNNHGSIAEGIVPEYNMNYIPEYNRNQNISGNENHHDGHPPHSRSD